MHVSDLQLRVDETERELEKERSKCDKQGTLFITVSKPDMVNRNLEFPICCHCRVQTPIMDNLVTDQKIISLSLWQFITGAKII